MTAPIDVRYDANYTLKETLTLLGISRTTLYRYANEGKLTIKHNKRNKPYVSGRQIKSLL